MAPAVIHSTTLGPLFREPLPAWSYASFTQNLVMARQETLGPEWLGITWSLAVEEQFYLLLPFMVRFIAPLRLTIFVSTLALAAPVFRVLAEDDSGYAGMVLMPCRADALLLGVLCAWAMRRAKTRELLFKSRSAFYLILSTLLTVLAVFCSQPARFERSPYLPSVLAVLYTAFLLLAVTEQRGPVTWLVRQRWLRGLGILAYGVYLIHQAVNGLSHGIILSRSPEIGSWSGLAVTLLALGITLGVAALSWLKFEKPLVNLGHTVRYERPGI